MIISKKTKSLLLEMLEEFGVKQSCVAQFIERHEGKLSPTEEALSEMSLQELKAIKGMVQYKIHEKEGVAASPCTDP